MKNIRKSCFETNSSSSHSLVIDHTNTCLTSIAPDADGCIRLPGNSYGWEWEKYTDALSKADYCAAHAENNTSLQEMLRQVIMEQTGAKDVFFGAPSKYGSIDHQSIGTASEAFASDEALRNFIFNPKCILYTGNDNSSPPPNFYDVDKAYTCQLHLEGSPKPFYLTAGESDSPERIEDALRQLFERNRYNRFNAARMGSDEQTAKLFDWPYRPHNEPQPKPVDFDEKTLTVEYLIPTYGRDDGKFTGYGPGTQKVLRWNITT